MKIRIIQQVQQGDKLLMPGEFHELPDKQALKLIKDGLAVEWKDEKKKSEVNDGNR